MSADNDRDWSIITHGPRCPPTGKLSTVDARWLWQLRQEAIAMRGVVSAAVATVRAPGGPLRVATWPAFERAVHEYLETLEAIDVAASAVDVVTESRKQ